jgi:hypothetical protein
MAAERKYPLVKIKAGDWLLLSNDRTMLWRIYRFNDLDWDGWACARYDGTPAQAVDENYGLEHAWDRWVVTAYVKTRQQAIDEALETTERRNGG